MFTNYRLLARRWIRQKSQGKGDLKNRFINWFFGMGYSKRRFILSSLEEIGIASHAFDITPDQLAYALTRLDAMMADWNGKGIRIGYPIPSDPSFSDIDADSNVPDCANEAIITNLAIKLCASYGKQVHPETKIAANNSYNTLLQRVPMAPVQRYYSTLPIGSGWKPWRYGDEWGYPYVPKTVDVGIDSELELY